MVAISFHRTPVFRVIIALFVCLFVAAPNVEASYKIQSFSGVPYIGLKDLAKRLGMRFEWVQSGKKVKLSSKWSELKFEKQTRDFYLNRNRIFLGHPVKLYNGQLYVSKSDIDKNVLPLLAPHKLSSVPSLRTIVIDPGHGGKDSGTRSPFYNLIEKKLTLEIAKNVKAILERAGYKVYLTRNDDSFVPLMDRAAYANRHHADLFISLHLNSARNPQAYGVETFAYTPVGQPSTARGQILAVDRKTHIGNQTDVWNAFLGYNFQRNLVRKLNLKDRGVKRARFTVLEAVKSPGVLIEMGFLSNPDEAKLLNKQGYRQQLAEVIAQSVLVYGKELKRFKNQA